MPIRLSVRQEDEQQSEFQGFLSGEVILVWLLGAELALFLSKPGLRTSWELPSLHLILMTLYAVGGALVALLSAGRFSAEGRRFDLMLCGGFFTSRSTSLSTSTPAFCTISRATRAMTALPS